MLSSLNMAFEVDDFPCGGGCGGGGSDQALSQAAPYVISYHNLTPLLPPTPITANEHHPPSTSDTHNTQPPLMPPTTSIRHCTAHHGG